MANSDTSTRFVRDPGRIAELAKAIAARTLTSADLVETCLARIDAVDDRVRAWRVVDADRARATARARDQEAAAGRLRGPLHGIPIAIKDIIDVEGLPTRCNSRSRQQATPATADAAIVRALKAQGAVVIGKAHTTEFAFQDPAPTGNPHDIGHTPGGSSSGSAAAVAAGMVPLAVGTQTVASVNRPAAYCGIAAFKPTTGSLLNAGIAPLATSYDTPGFFGWSVADAIYAYEAIAHANRPPAVPADRQAMVYMLDDAHLMDATADVVAAVDAVRERLIERGVKVERRASPIDFARLAALQWSTTIYEAGRAMRGFLQLADGQIGSKLREAITRGCAISETQYLDERQEISRLRHTLQTAVAAADACLWPATPSTAPEGLGWTGDPKYIGPWTASAGPILSVPSAVTGDGLPLGCIVIGKPGADAELVALAKRYLA